jgi:uncharacterized SAM-binding protein YcdF (DUF218 family)
MQQRMKKVLLISRRIINCFIYSCGVIFLLLSVSAFTRIPFDVQLWLGTSESKYSFTPDYIVMMGAGGMPEGENLIRLFYTLQTAEAFPQANLIIAQSLDTAVSNYMAAELIHHGVDSYRIFVENHGTNTRSQALAVSEDFADALDKNVLIISSPLHMRRVVKVFRKIGFKNVGGEPCFSQSVFPDLSYDHKKIGGKRYVPDVSTSLKLRYNFWNYFSLQIGCLRELCALFYYKLNGWI